MTDEQRRRWTKLGVILTAATLVVMLGGAVWSGGSVISALQQSDVTQNERLDELEKRRKQIQDMMVQQAQNTNEIKDLEGEVKQLREDMNEQFARLFDHLGMPQNKIDKNKASPAQPRDIQRAPLRRHNRPRHIRHDR